MDDIAGLAEEARRRIVESAPSLRSNAVQAIVDLLASDACKCPLSPKAVESRALLLLSSLADLDAESPVVKA